MIEYRYKSCTVERIRDLVENECRMPGTMVPIQRYIVDLYPTINLSQIVSSEVLVQNTKEGN